MKRNFFFLLRVRIYFYLFIYFFWGALFRIRRLSAHLLDSVAGGFCQRAHLHAVVQGAEPKKFAYRAHLRSVALRLVPERRRLHFADASLFRRRVDPLEKKKNVTKKNRTDRRSIDI